MLARPPLPGKIVVRSAVRQRAMAEQGHRRSARASGRRCAIAVARQSRKRCGQMADAGISRCAWTVRTDRSRSARSLACASRRSRAGHALAVCRAGPGGNGRDSAPMLANRSSGNGELQRRPVLSLKLRGEEGASSRSRPATDAPPNGSPAEVREPKRAPGEQGEHQAVTVPIAAPPEAAANRGLGLGPSNAGRLLLSSSARADLRALVPHRSCRIGEPPCDRPQPGPVVRRRERAQDLLKPDDPLRHRSRARPRLAARPRMPRRLLALPEIPVTYSGVQRPEPAGR